MASENEKRETLADVVAEMRMGNDGGKPAYRIGRADKVEISMPSGQPIRSMVIEEVHISELADRLEAAWKRDEERAVEHATRHAEAVARDNCRDCVHNPKGKNYEVGNAAAMREALELMAEGDSCSSDDPLDCLEHNCVYQQEPHGTAGEDCPWKKVRAALSSPARNCDRPECATSKDAQNVWRKEDGGKTPYYEWLFAPAAERKGEGK